MGWRDVVSGTDDITCALERQAVARSKHRRREAGIDYLNNITGILLAGPPFSFLYDCSQFYHPVIV